MNDLELISLSLTAEYFDIYNEGLFGKNLCSLKDKIDMECLLIEEGTN